MKILLMIFLFSSQLAVNAAVFNVSNNQDSGAGSLRQAILDANALAGEDTITFDSGLNEITLSTGEIIITDTLLIQGPAAGQIINGSGSYRIFSVTDSAVVLSIINIRMTNAGRLPIADNPGSICRTNSENGGAICVAGDLFIQGSNIDNNSLFRPGISDGSNDPINGGGIYVGGNLSLINSTVDNHDIRFTDSRSNFRGAGIYVVGNLEVRNSRIADNRCEDIDGCEGGGFFVEQGDVDIVDSVIASNTADFVLDELKGQKAGAGFILQGNLRMINSTIYGNSSFNNPGIWIDNGDAYISNSTISANRLSYNRAIGEGYGLRVNGTLTMYSTVISGTSQFDRDDRFFYKDCFATSLNPLSSHNVIGSNSSTEADPSCGIVSGVNNNVVGFQASSQTGLDIRLQDNGCAVTVGISTREMCVETVSSEVGSSLIVDKGINPNSLAFDQRGTGFIRQLDGNNNGEAIADVGAYEQTAQMYDGLCGYSSFNGLQFAEPPSDFLCHIGQPTAVLLQSSEWTWSCLGSMGGSDAQCDVDASLQNLTLNSTNGSIDCVPNPVAIGQTVTCQAEPDAGFIFDQWGGVCEVFKTPDNCTFTFDGNAEVIALFRGSLGPPQTVPTMNAAMKLALCLAFVLLSWFGFNNRYRSVLSRK